ncbi:MULTISPECIES: hypothetical protein [Lysobacter]|uniref:hypothetical protein n=1 Tax=Lysobacter TaxID=68 RepID=UPI001F3E9AC1|nr:MULTISPECIES: hypothetical protein [Lysobacter]UJB21009.1 hypothetical protein L1A79_08095 [Lysobacter capsici]UJQ29875.1 hypothetical protein L2D09_06760 [Lysobacter gummosus]
MYIFAASLSPNMYFLPAGAALKRVRIRSAAPAKIRCGIKSRVYIDLNLSPGAARRNAGGDRTRLRCAFE